MTLGPSVLLARAQPSPTAGFYGRCERGRDGAGEGALYGTQSGACHWPLYSPGLKSGHAYGKARWDARVAGVQEKRERARQTATVSAAVRPSGHPKSVCPFSVHMRHTQARRSPAEANPGSLAPRAAHCQGRLGDEQGQTRLFTQQPSNCRGQVICTHPAPPLTCTGAAGTGNHTAVSFGLWKNGSPTAPPGPKHRAAPWPFPSARC